MRQVKEGFELVSHPNLLKSYMLEFFYRERITVRKNKLKITIS